MYISTFFAFSIVCLAVGVSSDCFKLPGCTDGVTHQIYENGYRWKPRGHPCYSCKCYQSRQYVLGCQVIADKVKVKKSEYSAAFGQISFLPAEEVEIREEEIVNITCETLPLPAYDPVTQELESITYQNVYYFYTYKRTHCCSRFDSYDNLHPSCMAVPVGECKTRIVQRGDPNKLCEEPYNVLGK
ncbi:uncharacterized protein LOC144428070 [Styela clava]